MMVSLVIGSVSGGELATLQMSTTETVANTEAAFKLGFR